MMTKRLIRAVLLIALAFAAGAYVYQLVSLQTFKRRFARDLEAGSDVVPTERGPIEYASVGEGPAVVFLHGTPGGYDQALVFARPFVESGFRLIAPSRPGYLRTPLSAGKTAAEQADAIEALIEALGIDHVAVVGASGGAPSAVAFAQRHPDRAWALVTLVGLLEPKDRNIPPLTVTDRITNRLFGRDFTTWRLLRAMEDAPRESFAFANASSRSRLLADSTKVAQFFEMAWTRFPRERREAGWANDREQYKTLDFGEAARIQTPTLVVHGTADVNAPFQGAAAFAERVPNAALIRVEDGDHYIMVARGEELWPQVMKFLWDVAPR